MTLQYRPVPVFPASRAAVSAYEGKYVFPAPRVERRERSALPGVPEIRLDRFDLFRLYPYKSLPFKPSPPPLVRAGPGAKRRGRGCTIVQVENEINGNLPREGVNEVKAGRLLQRSFDNACVKSPYILPAHQRRTFPHPAPRNFENEPNGACPKQG